MGCVASYQGLSPHLPVIILTDRYADDLRISQADVYFVKNSDCIDKFKRKIAGILGNTKSGIPGLDKGRPAFETFPVIKKIAHDGKKLIRQILGYARKGI